MAFPVLLKKLFKNEGAGPELRQDIIPKLDASQMPADYLEKSGGTMSGTLTIAPASAIKKPVNSGNLTVMGGTDYPNGAYVQLYGKDSETNPGGFTLAARDGTNNKYFIGKPDGSLLWGDKSVVTTGGGIMVGTLKTTQNGSLARDGTSEYLGLFGSGTDWWNNGSSICLYGVDNSANGQFSVTAVFKNTDGTVTKKALVGKGSGELTWGGNAVLTNNFTNAWVINRDLGHIHKSGNTGNMTVRGGGSNDADGARITLYGSSHASYPGRFELKCHDGTNAKSLVGKPDGGLVWADKNIVRSVNNTSADADGNVSITSVTKATQDSDGKAINTTYAKLAGATFTGAVKATSFQATSDSRLKDNIEPVKYRFALNALNSINTYSYNLKNDSIEGKRYGVIAQEVQEVLPEVVKQGNEEYYSVDYSGLTAICVAAINELTVRVQFLERQLAEITNQKETK